MKLEINEKKPLECTDISEVRHEIDNIDTIIIQLLAQRLEYVKEVVKYKDATTSGIEATDRRATVIESRRQWAEKAGISPDVVEKIYNDLIEFFICEEKKIANIEQ